MTCSVCKRNRQNVTTKKSALMPGIDLILCNECLDNKREPRWMIIMAGRSGNTDKIKPYLRHHRYCGDKITAEEILV